MNEPDPNAELQALERFVEALRHSQNERVFVPPQVDAVILEQARRHLQPQRGRFVSLPRWAAMAASVALAAGLISMLIRARLDEPVREAASTVFSIQDINTDGEVDILDALALARKIEAGEPVDADLNGDGVVDRRDAETLAGDIVKLEKGKRS